jgi:hypothetical protein
MKTIHRRTGKIKPPPEQNRVKISSKTSAAAIFPAHFHSVRGRLFPDLFFALSNPFFPARPGKTVKIFEKKTFPA